MNLKNREINEIFLNSKNNLFPFTINKDIDTWIPQEKRESFRKKYFCFFVNICLNIYCIKLFNFANLNLLA